MTVAKVLTPSFIYERGLKTEKLENISAANSHVEGQKWCLGVVIDHVTMRFYWCVGVYIDITCIHTTGARMQNITCTTTSLHPHT